MKNYNVQHEASIYSFSHSDKEQKKKAKEGDMIDHYQLVNQISFYTPIGNGNYANVFLDRDFILDLADQIKEIESVKTKEKFEDLPF